MIVKHAYRDVSGNIHTNVLLEATLHKNGTHEQVTITKKMVNRTLTEVHETMDMFHCDFRWNYVESMIREWGDGQYQVEVS